MRNSKLIRISLFVTSLQAIGIGCTNSLLVNLQTRLPSQSSTGTPTPSSSATATNPDQIIISSITIAGAPSASATPSPTATASASSNSGNSSTSGNTASGTGSTGPTTSIYFNTVSSTANISAHCAVSSALAATSTNKNCLCQFSWVEINTVGNSYTPIPHQIQNPLLTIQPNALTCSAPSIYYTEIPDGTPIQITVIAAPSNPDTGLFNVPPGTYTKASGATTATFSDALGRSFINISHYACYNLFQTSPTVFSASTTQENPDPAASDKTRTVFLGSHFCTGGANASGSSGSVSCPSSSQMPKTLSSQLYYFNFYIRTTDSGGINQYNTGFVCPLVYESLVRNSNIGTQSGQLGQYWPMDQTFSLSYSPTADFPIGIDANSQLAGGSDPTNQSVSCASIAAGNTSSSTTSSSSSSSSGGVTSSCLGFAATPNSDGTCPFLKDSSGQLRATYRLRRYIAIYPKTFNPDGSIISGAGQPTDTIYVLDRPVLSSSTNNPYKPFTMLGPKPCPSAYYDSTGVTQTTTSLTDVPQYLGTSNRNWVGKNIDGTQFPNFDNLTEQTCSATVAVPVIDYSSGNFQYWGLRTINKNLTDQFNVPTPFTHLFVRPKVPFVPHYEEDTTLRACAPQAAPVIDAPLHFMKYATTDSGGTTTTHTSWCSESYPTQNDNVGTLVSKANTSNISQIRPYTSHTVKGSISSICSSTPLRSIPSASPTALPTPYPLTGLAYHSPGETLPYDENQSATATCDRTVISQTATWANFPLLAPANDVESSLQYDSSYRCTISYDANGIKTGSQEPKDGCCQAGIITYSAASAAHLEPDQSCLSPHY